MRQLKASVWIMAIIGVFLVIGSLLSSFGLWEGYYKSVFFIVAAVVFLLILAVCLIKYGFSFKRLGFYLCHTGVLLVIVCAFISTVAMKDTSFAIPINPYSFYGEVMQDDGSQLSFGFEISVASFEVEKYDAEYCLYKSKTDFTEQNVVIETVKQNRKGIYNLGEYGSLEADQLRKNNAYVDYFALDNGYTLVKYPEVDKYYSAILQIYDNGEVKEVELGVNKPYTYKGWKFYLMGYDTESLGYINLYVKNDPGNFPFAIGLWMTIAGTFVESLSLIKRKEVAKNDRA